ncbi:MAG: hypothetical protein KDD70_18295, partial [Bdellovibrionales bacterium]|nr:hypothetical protein [Bdellovibrionales bacterium]
TALTGSVEIPVPEYFNGTIRLLAVAVGGDKLGFASSQSIAQQDFVIEPQLPYFVSPGDEFEVGATVANTVVGSGADVQLAIKVIPPESFEALETKPILLTVPEGQDQSFRVRMKAGSLPGEQEIRFVAEGIGKITGASETISVRPAHPFRTSLQTGIYRPDKDGDNAEKHLSPTRTLYPQLRRVTASISQSPLSLGRALMGYLKEYPYGCTEQLVSVAFPAVIFGTNEDFGLSNEDVKRFTSRAFQVLSARQLADGSFAMWDGMYESDPLFSVYATHFLLEGSKRQLEIPTIVLERATKWVKDFSAEPKYELPLQLAKAYALYLQTQSGTVVSKEALAFQQDLDRQWGTDWRESAIALFLAGAFSSMKMDEQAKALLKAPPEVWKGDAPWPLSDAALYGAIYSWISSKHFSADTWLSPLDTVIPLERMIRDKSLYSFNASFAILGLSAAAERMPELQSKALRIAAETASKETLPLEVLGKTLLAASVPESAAHLQFSGEAGKIFFFGLEESGFDSDTPQPIAAGVSLHRELKNGAGEMKAAFSLNEKVEVTLFLKAEKGANQVAVVELIPGGFEVDLSDEGLANRRSLHE